MDLLTLCGGAHLYSQHSGSRGRSITTGQPGVRGDWRQKLGYKLRLSKKSSQTWTYLMALGDEL